jgi:hypothetical protein
MPDTYQHHRFGWLASNEAWDIKRAVSVREVTTATGRQLEMTDGSVSDAVAVVLRGQLCDESGQLSAVFLMRRDQALYLARHLLWQALRVREETQPLWRVLVERITRRR